MLRKFIRRVFSKSAPKPGASHAPALLPVARHGVHREGISPAARHTVQRLQESGHQAYVVGGAVRDLIAGIKPKDFDVATDATPEQVRGIFRRSRIIGRRFRIVHVMSGSETIEVSTFRTADTESATDEHGRVLRDNVFGNMEEDAARRDFTVNALYYNPADETILDYHHGVADLQQKTLRMIGEAKTRYREDPIRMLRAVRMASKLGLTIDPAARAPIREMADLLQNVPAARLFDEMLKLLLSGHAVECLKQLREEGLHDGLLPMLDVIMEQPLGERFVWLSLTNTDERVQAGKPVSPGFLFATLLWHEVLSAWGNRKLAGEHAMPALHATMDQVLDTQAEKLAITRRIAGDIKEIWALQPRFENRAGRRPLRLLEQPRFKAGLDFLLLRAASGEVAQELGDWWLHFLDADTDERLALLTPEKKPARRRRARKPAAGENGNDAQSDRSEQIVDS